MQLLISLLHVQRDRDIDRVMNWVVGAMLLGAVAFLAFVQTHPPV